MPQTPLCPSSTSSGFQLGPSQAFCCESQGNQQSCAGSQLCLLSIKPLHNRRSCAPSKTALTSHPHYLHTNPGKELCCSVETLPGTASEKDVFS